MVTGLEMVFNNLHGFSNISVVHPCFSYRRFFASRDASSKIRTQVERFGRFFVYNFDANL